MAYPVTLNGRTYTLADFEGTNYVEGLPDAFEDFVTHAGDIYNSTSTTSNSIGTGSKTFTVESAKPYQAGTPLRIADAAAPSTNFMDTIVTSYSGTTLVVDAVGYAGSGTFTSWNVNIGGAASVQGTLGIAQGGTGAATAAAARTNLDVYSKADADSRFLNVSGEASDVTMTGNVTIGDAAGDTLSVPATASFSGGISGDVAFDTDTLYVDSTNDLVGIGNSTPSSYNTGSNNLVIGNGGSNGISIHAGVGMLHFTNGADTTERVSIKSTVASNTLEFSNGNGEAMRIDSSRRVLIGDTTGRSGFGKKLEIMANDSLSSISLVRASNSTGASAFLSHKSRGTLATPLIVQNDDNTLQLTAHPYDGTDYGSQSARISMHIDGTPGANDTPGRIMFETTADGASAVTERMRITNNGRVGINTVGESGAPTAWLTIDNDINSADVLTNKSSYHISLGLDGANTDHYIGGIGFGDITQTTIQAAISAVDNGTSAATGLAFATGNTSSVNEAMRINSSQRVLIGQTDARNSFFGNNVGTYNPRFQVEGVNTSSGARMISFVHNDDSNNGFIQIFGRSRGTTANSLTVVGADDNLGAISFQGATGNALAEAGQITVQVDGTPGSSDMPGRIIFRTTADGASSSTERMRITNSGSVLVNTTTGGEHFRVKIDSNGYTDVTNTIGFVGANNQGLYFASHLDGTGYGMDIVSRGYSATLGDLRFIRINGSYQNPVETARFDENGHFLLGQSSTAQPGVGNTTVGASVRSDGLFFANSSASRTGTFGRNSDGPVLGFYNNGTTVGHIGTDDSQSTGEKVLYITSNSNTTVDVGLRFDPGPNQIQPCDAGGADRDNAIDLGGSSDRFDDIYATNGTIQTSDQNEKQQIASLTDAEITAAKAISQLFKTFKWNDSVAEKGDAARTHSGVIAQDVEQAMSDAGLNAGDYAFFISTTWWEADETFTDDEGVEQTRTRKYNSQDNAPEGATERNRKGIRYPQLLSFIGAATEQRLASIEARLDALET